MIHAGGCHSLRRRDGAHRVARSRAIKLWHRRQKYTAAGPVGWPLRFRSRNSRVSKRIGVLDVAGLVKMLVAKGVHIFRQNGFFPGNFFVVSRKDCTPNLFVFNSWRETPTMRVWVRKSRPLAGSWYTSGDQFLRLVQINRCKPKIHESC